MKLALEGGGNLLLEDGTDFLLEEPWPDDGPGTNYCMAAAANGGSDSNPGTKASPWENPYHASTYGGYGSGDVTINLRSGDTFTGDFGVASGPSSFTIQGLQHPIPPALVDLGSSVQAVGPGTGGTLPLVMGAIYTLANVPVTVRGIKLLSPYNFGIWCQDYNEVSYCEVGTQPGNTSTPFYDIASGGKHVSVHHNLIGGTSATSIDGCGILLNYASYVTAYYNEIRFCGGVNPDVVNTGYGVHATVFDLPSTTPVALTFSAGVPTNALCDIRYNYIHDTGGNLYGNGASAIEAAGDRIVVQDNLIAYQRSVYGPISGTDFDGIDYDINSTNGLCQRNLIVGCDGCALLSFAGGQWGNNTFRYNIAVDCGQSSFANVGLQGFGTSTTEKWYNNTTVQTIHTGAFSSDGVYFKGMDNSTGCFANNIVATLAYSGGGIWTFDGIGSIPSSFVVGNNDWYGIGLGFNCYGMTGTTYGSLAAIAAAIPNFDAGSASISANPQFVGTPGSFTGADYVLGPMSPCRGAGVDPYAAFGEDPGDYDFFGNSVRGGAVSGGSAVPAHMGAHAYG